LMASTAGRSGQVTSFTCAVPSLLTFATTDPALLVITSLLSHFCRTGTFTKVQTLQNINVRTHVFTSMTPSPQGSVVSFHRSLLSLVKCQRTQGLIPVQGTKELPIRITSYPGTRAIVDGTTASPGVGQVRLPPHSHLECLPGVT
jgi:hypothetical protein